MPPGKLFVSNTWHRFDLLTFPVVFNVCSLKQYQNGMEVNEGSIIERFGGGEDTYLKESV